MQTNWINPILHNNINDNIFWYNNQEIVNCALSIWFRDGPFMFIAIVVWSWLSQP